MKSLGEGRQVGEGNDVPSAPLFIRTVPEGATHTWGFFHIQDSSQNTSSAEAPYSADSNV